MCVHSEPRGEGRHGPAAVVHVPRRPGHAGGLQVGHGDVRRPHEAGGARRVPRRARTTARAGRGNSYQTVCMD